MSYAHIINSTTICIVIPPEVNSHGIWNQEHPVLTHTLPLLQLQIFLYFGITEALDFIFRNFGLQKICAQILAGMIMGPEVFGSYLPDVWSAIFPEASRQLDLIVGLFSYVIFMFTIGVRIDVGIIYHSGKMTYILGILPVLVPYIVGVVAYHFMATYYSLGSKEKGSLAFLAGIVASTQFTDVIMILEDLKIINSELGRLCMSSTMISGAISISIHFVSIISRICREVSVPMGLTSAVLLTAFSVFLKVVVRPIMFWIIKQTPQGRPVKGLYIYTIAVMALAASVFTNKIGHFSSTGSLFVGLTVPAGPPLGSAIIEKFDGFLNGVLLPFLVSVSMLGMTIHANANIIASSAITCIVVWLTKMVTCLVPPLYAKMPINDALVIAFILSTKGISEVAIYSLLGNSKTLMKETFVVLPFISLFCSFFASLLVKYLYDPARKYANYQKRNIMHTQNSSHLKMLACVYKSDDSFNIIHFLGASNSTSDNPINVDILHLVELVGRASPIFISHQLQTKAVTKQSYSDKIIEAFAEFAATKTNSIFIQIFTAISPLKLMHEDICTLALNKQAAIILLPFHRKWTMDGSMEIEDNNRRALNCSVLDKAPCSVGILIDVCNNSTTLKTKHNVCLIFIGGNDDREALTLVKRSIGNPDINLTVLRLLATSEHDLKLGWSEMLDSEQLREVKLTSNEMHTQVAYLEEVVEDGGHTSRVIQSIVSQFDVIIVGRRHLKNTPQILGLMEWSEYPELGVLGDLLVTSKDANMKALILVVQQQIMS